MYDILCPLHTPGLLLFPLPNLHVSFFSDRKGTFFCDLQEEPDRDRGSEMQVLFLRSYHDLYTVPLPTKCKFFVSESPGTFEEIKRGQKSNLSRATLARSLQRRRGSPRMRGAPAVPSDEPGLLAMDLPVFSTLNKLVC